MTAARGLPPRPSLTLRPFSPSSLGNSHKIPWWKAAYQGTGKTFRKSEGREQRKEGEKEREAPASHHLKPEGGGAPSQPKPPLRLAPEAHRAGDWRDSKKKKSLSLWRRREPLVDSRTEPSNRIKEAKAEGRGYIPIASPPWAGQEAEVRRPSSSFLPQRTFTIFHSDLPVPSNTPISQLHLGTGDLRMSGMRALPPPPPLTAPLLLRLGNLLMQEALPHLPHQLLVPYLANDLILAPWKLCLENPNSIPAVDTK
ncbi:uncharacterized protein LOC130455114 [Monodelphis domestica]|uniref:uncharacterized protein LOC130455114 n=1 Tax=Monodelphis domestica TaxID=13616 RepID=UPI0024E22258|nr:uncharacterized protein LOC130455114 [Monodelphis domestica]